MSEIPQHVAIIMDGNGRWAKQRNLPRTFGHQEGVKRVEEIVEVAAKDGVKVLTLFTFSTENWTRPQDEVSMLMKTLCEILTQKLEKLAKGDIQFRLLGKREGVPTEVIKTIDWAIERTRNNTGMILNMAFNYGSRLEIIDAVKVISRQVADGALDEDAIDEKLVSDSLYTQGLPDPDLLIRTSGEQRISNFLLWQLSYAELYFTDKYWPDFTVTEWTKALDSFAKRERRYGDISAIKE